MCNEKKMSKNMKSIEQINDLRCFWGAELYIAFGSADLVGVSVNICVCDMGFVSTHVVLFIAKVCRIKIVLSCK